MTTVIVQPPTNSLGIPQPMAYVEGTEKTIVDSLGYIVVGGSKLLDVPSYLSTVSTPKTQTSGLAEAWNYLLLIGGGRMYVKKGTYQIGYLYNSTIFAVPSANVNLNIEIEFEPGCVIDMGTASAPADASQITVISGGPSTSGNYASNLTIKGNGLLIDFTNLDLSPYSSYNVGTFFMFVSNPQNWKISGISIQNIPTSPSTGAGGGFCTIYAGGQGANHFYVKDCAAYDVPGDVTDPLGNDIVFENFTNIGRANNPVFSLGGTNIRIKGGYFSAVGEIYKGGANDEVVQVSGNSSNIEVAGIVSDGTGGYNSIIEVGSDGSSGQVISGVKIHHNAFIFKTSGANSLISVGTAVPVYDLDVHDNLCIVTSSYAPNIYYNITEFNTVVNASFRNLFVYDTNSTPVTYGIISAETSGPGDATGAQLPENVVVKGVYGANAKGMFYANPSTGTSVIMADIEDIYGTVQAVWYNPNNLTGSSAAYTVYTLRNLPVGLSVATPGVTANPPVSGTVYQNENPYDIELVIPVTLNPTSTAAASAVLQIASSLTSTGALNNPLTVDTETAPAGLASGFVKALKARIPAGWYYELTLTNAAASTATVLPA